MLQGERLAVVVNDPENVASLSLKIYDTRMASAQEVVHTSLSDADPYGSAAIAFSADGVYIAIGREANYSQIFDSRFPKRDILTLRHKNKASDGYGITSLEWVDATKGPNRSHNILATGGDDGILSLNPAPFDLSLTHV